jgi:hypothetical protein
MSEEKDVNFSVGSIVSGRDFEPYVQVSITMPDGRQSRVQFTPEQARTQAQFILQAAEAAESDHFVMQFAIEQLGSMPNAAAALLDEFRNYREKRREMARIDGA